MIYRKRHVFVVGRDWDLDDVRSYLSENVKTFNPKKVVKNETAEKK